MAIARDVMDTTITDYLQQSDWTVTILPDPEPEELWCPIISVDDHLLEPLTVFEERVPRRFHDRMPRIELDERRYPWWIVDDARVPILVGNGTSGRPMEEWGVRLGRHEDFRDGVWKPEARLADMDCSGIWASLCFGSVPWGFAGSRFSSMRDADVGLASMRAYNDWILEDWCAADPDRFIPCQYAWLRDADIAAAEIRRNADRGFKAVSFSENPEALGYPSIYDTYWDPFFHACEDTGTVVNLHVGSSGRAQRPSSASPSDVWVALFPAGAITSTVDWIYAKIPIRFPSIKIAMSEGGASWVPMVVERLRRAYRQVRASVAWATTDPDPVELLYRNFWFCSLEDPAAYRMLDVIGADNIMIETDYPHQDSTWPEAQKMIRNQIDGMDGSTIRKICFDNASQLYRHPPPPRDWLDRSIVGAGD